MTTRPTVWFASTGPAVLDLQEALERHRLYSLLDGDDPGVFGPCTEQSLKAFQAMRGLRADGFCDEQIWAALETD